VRRYKKKDRRNHSNGFGQETFRVLGDNRIYVVEAGVQSYDKAGGANYPEQSGARSGQVQNRNCRYIRHKALLIDVELSSHDRVGLVHLSELKAYVEQTSKDDEN
jgi:hypothetical protein